MWENMQNRNYWCEAAIYCDGFIIVPLRGVLQWKCRILYIVENHVAKVDTTTSQSCTVDIMYKFHVKKIKK